MGPMGGFGSSPKFPTSHNISFLLRYQNRSGNRAALEIAERTLVAMAKGGLYDQLGGGFHRYSTDPYWHVPHFEKMLYDQAILAKTYLEAYQVTHNLLYANVAREVFNYCLRDLRDPLGGFYSAVDADSAADADKPREKTEGAFYVWEEGEVQSLLSKEDAQIAIAFFGMETGGNAPQDPHGEFTNKNILIIKREIKDLAGELGQPEDEIRESLKKTRAILWHEREKRPHPHLDDKVLTDWNGLMISSLAYGSRVLGDDTYLEAAKGAADFILNNLVDKKGRLLHRWREGEAGIPGFIEDYAFFIHGLIDLYEASFETKYLERALYFSKEMIRLFWDEKEGGFYLTAIDGERLVVRPKELYDGAIPSGNSVAALDLIRLSRLTMDKEVSGKIEEMMQFMFATAEDRPSGFGQALWAFDFYLGPSREIVIAGNLDNPETKKLIDVINSKYLPNSVLIQHPESGLEKEAIEKLSPFIKEQVAEDGKPLVFVCENFVCQFPTGDIQKLNQLLNTGKE